jgi:hypothetical protein
MLRSRLPLLLCSAGILFAAVLLASFSPNEMPHARAQEPENKETALRVPAFTAYTAPNADSPRLSEKNGITGWSDAAQSISWYGNIKTPGRLHLALAVRLPAETTAKLRLTVAGKSLMTEVRGAADGTLRTVNFGTVEIPKTGYQRFHLEGIAKTGATFGDIDALLLSGPAAVGAHFNLKERRNAASVHLGYPIPDEATVTAFYNEVTVKTDPTASYYMACGFRRGYFGIQVNSPTERRVIFSVWDAGTEAVDRKKVADDNRVQLLAKGEDVYAGGFGNEGTGGHSHLKYRWKTGDTYRFLVTAKPDGTHTIYTGWFYFPEKKAWGLIASFRAPKDGGTLRGLYSFNENFWGSNGDKQRLAEFGNQWIQTADGKWTELTKARFTHDGTGKEDRKDYDGGVRGKRFFLSNGGFLPGKISYGETFDRPALGKAPDDVAELLKKSVQ